MRKGFLAALTALLVGQGLAVAQNWGPYPPGHAWGPMGPPPSPPTMIRVWTPPAPVLRPPVYAQPGAVPPRLAGWPPQQSQPAAPKAPAAPVAPPSPVQRISNPPPVDRPANADPIASPEPPPADNPPPPALLNPAPANTAPMPVAGDTQTPFNDHGLPLEHLPPAEESHQAKETHDKPFGFWASGEYLFWWFKNGRVPPLVTSGGDGVPGTPGTTIALDNLNFDNDYRHGGRFSLGYHFKQVPFIGVETNYFFVSDRESKIGFASAGEPVLARPFANILTGASDSVLIAAPDVASGALTVASRTWLWGTESNLAVGLICSDKFHLAMLGGFRYLSLEDELTIAEQVTASIDVPDIGGSTVGIVDSFRTVNRFYGGQLGAEVGVQLAKLTFDVRGKIALGTMHQVAYVNGATGVLGAGGPNAVFPGGFLALPSNIGRYDRDVLTFIPEVGVNLGMQVTHHFKLFAGYSFLWINNVARAGEEIDPVINVTQLPSPAGPGVLAGPARPAFDFQETDFWAQGLNFGFEFRY